MEKIIKLNFKNIKNFINNNILIICLLLLFLISCVYIIYKNIVKRKKEFSKKEYDYIHKVLLENLKKTIKIFDKHGLTYWASDGTLLGSIRDNDIIEYDDDVDFRILKEDYLKLAYDEKIKNDFNKSGLHLSFSEDSLKKFQIIKIVKLNESNDYTRNNIFIDIIPVEKENNRYILSEIYARNLWKNSYFYENELFPLKKNKFNNLSINIPNNPIPYLERAYGDCKNKPSRHGPCWKIPNHGKPHHFKEINLKI